MEGEGHVAWRIQFAAGHDIIDIETELADIAFINSLLKDEHKITRQKQDRGIIQSFQRTPINDQIGYRILICAITDMPLSYFIHGLDLSFCFGQVEAGAEAINTLLFPFLNSVSSVFFHFLNELVFEEITSRGKRTQARVHEASQRA